MFRSYTSSENISKTRASTPVHPSGPYSCDICQESLWLTETDVELHRKEKHFDLIRDQMEKHKERFCTVCMKLQDSHSSLIAHIKTRHLFSSSLARRVEREIFICNDCDRIFFNKHMLQAHIKFSHLWKNQERNNKYFTCPKCRRNIKLKSIWFHFQKHEIPSISACDICFTHFENVEELEKHVKEHSMFYKCEICSYQVTREVYFEAHLNQHHKSPFKVAKIGSLFNRVFPRQVPAAGTIARYNIHQSLRGLDLPRCMQICILCREICTDQIEARNHILREHLKAAESRRRARCRCGKEFFNRVLLRHHIFKEKGYHQECDGTESTETPELGTMETISVSIEIPTSPVQYVEVEQTDNQKTVDAEDCTLREDATREELMYIYAEVDEDQLITIDSETNEEVIGF